MTLGSQFNVQAKCLSCLVRYFPMSYLCIRKSLMEDAPFKSANELYADGLYQVLGFLFVLELSGLHQCHVP